jgi:hypothetical protein
MKNLIFLPTLILLVSILTSSLNSCRKKADTIAKIAVRDAQNALVPNATVIVFGTPTEPGNVNIRGAREDANYYYIDGVKVRGSSNLPKSYIGEVTVYTGSIPANYGDITGGVISIESKPIPMGRVSKRMNQPTSPPANTYSPPTNN